MKIDYAKGKGYFGCECSEDEFLCFNYILGNFLKNKAASARESLTKI